uniref:Uncharacterized protein n=1 Tax=Anguilla anguilla TaxID=7936 RepID=A0A0E9S1H6_ANGAN
MNLILPQIDLFTVGLWKL